MGDDHDAAKREALRAADDAIHEARLIGDAAIHAYFSEDSDKKRNQRREELFKALIEPAQKGDARALCQLDQLHTELRHGDKPVTPFHWDIEFPEVFDRDNPGFDCFIGNPPFLGGKRTSTALGDAYRDWLTVVHVETSNNADLAAHFFRRAFSLVRDHGTFGLIATNTIAQGDTRITGLRFIVKNQCTLYSATRRLRWPGEAAVVVSVVHVCKGGYPPPYSLDGEDAQLITSHLFHIGGDDPPSKLLQNENLGHIGSIAFGMGFTFDDENEEATPLREMHRLLEKSTRNAEVIFPYIGGAEVNRDPQHAHSRYIIHFGDRSQEEAERHWPELMAIVRRLVRPYRETLKRDSYRKRWWQLGERQDNLYRCIQGLKSVLVVSRVQTNWSVSRLPAGSVAALAEALPLTAI